MLNEKERVKNEVLKMCSLQNNALSRIVEAFSETR